MPAMRPSTQVQQRAQLIASRPASSQHHAPRTMAVSSLSMAAEDNVDRSSTTDAGPSTSTGESLSDAALQQIVPAVSQAVLMSLNATNSNTQPTSSIEAWRLPVIAPGIVTPLADSTTQGHVASALQHVSGESFVQVSQRSLSGGMSHFNSITLAIDTQLSLKLKAKNLGQLIF